ncbi:2797_t:CDS:2 [Scutellospora calospora]|uniref:2797_t:CDS:1 n=1 Tax=Scutellospora calospora TaxID=85575 RepID=A0ACA9JXK5_9GLOM|nr:2797_t:CDS:2 [Scutellospora calospora]
MKEWANFYRLLNNTIETDVESDDGSDTEEQVDHNLTREFFILFSYNSKLTAINLHIDYQFQGKSLVIFASMTMYHCVPGYDAIDELDFSNDDDNLAMNNAPDNTIHRLDPEVVIRSGLKNDKTIDFAINFLRIRGRFSIKKFSLLDNDNINFTKNFESEAMCSSNDINPILKKDINLMHSPINLCYNNHENAYLNITIIENSDPLEIRTGKFRVIHAICSYFEHTLQSNTLIVLAPTGIVAVNICRSTIHSACKFSFDESLNTHSNLSEESLYQLQEYWSTIEYAMIDETSMIEQNLLLQFHTFTKKIKASDNSTLFAGINILFASDFMQLLLVLDKALYMPEKIIYFSPPVENETSKSANILENMHHSNITEIQLEALRSRILSDNLIDSEEWRDVTFLVTKNNLRVQLNLEAVKEYAYDNNQFIIYSYAIDSYNRKILTGNNLLKFLSVSDIKKNTLCGILPLSINMKVVLTVNICTNDIMANGSLGILQQIIYDQNSIDYSSSCKNNIVLKGPPKYVIIELTRRHANNSIYVMLSRIQKLNDLLILQLFNETILNIRQSSALSAEFIHIKEYAQRTALLKT